MAIWLWLMRFPAAFALAWSFAKARLSYKTNFYQDTQFPHQVQLSAAEKKRLCHYYWGVNYLSAVFALLRGKNRTRAEQVRFSTMAALAAFFDDMSDQFGANAQNTSSPESFGVRNDPRGLAVHWLNACYTLMPTQRLAALKKPVESVFQLESKGVQKSASPLALDVLAEVSAQKGGNSVLVFRQLLDAPPTTTEEEALYQFGALVQLCDDIFDVWFDRQAGIQTAARHWVENRQMDKLQLYFQSLIQQTQEAFLRLGRFRGALAWPAVYFLIAVTRVCIQHYALLGKKSATLPLDDRKSMVVDMGKTSNRLKAIKYIFSF